MAESGFEKDFGYLMPFLDRVAAAAIGLADPAARDELTRLMAGEKQRWSRIRQLLAGAAGNPAPSAGRPATPAPAEQPAETPRMSGPRFTVGSLRPRSR
ncbi:MAG TPA: hypothetical protein VNO70_22060 [Blastocatellia bacterium]|nr:hypothetical protein [Blastocatellia bacterium]